MMQPNSPQSLGNHKQALTSRGLDRLRRCVADRRGANLVEYIILVGVIALVAILGFQAFGKSVQNKVQEQGAKVDQIGN